MTRARPMVLPLIIAFSLACRPNAEHQRVDFERMRRQQRYSPYQDAPMFRDGMAMRTPPAQTLSREEFSVGQEVARGRHGNTALASVPIAVTPDLLAAGRREFGVYCAVCHSVEGVGGSASVVGRNMKPPPPSLLGDSARALSPGRLFELITTGRGRMPAYAWAIPSVDRWAVVAYLRSLQGVKQ